MNMPGFFVELLNTCVTCETGAFILEESGMSLSRH